MAVDPSLTFILAQDNFINFNATVIPYREQTILPSLLLEPPVTSYSKTKKAFTKEYNNLLEIQSVLDDINKQEYENTRDSLDYLSDFSSIFTNRAGLKLANLDALYRFTSFSLEQPNCLTPLRCLDLGAAPGAWTQYLQYRCPLSYNYLVSFKNGLAYDYTNLQTNRSDIIFNDDNSKDGDLLQEADDIIKYVKAKEIEGLDLIVADAASGVEDDREGKQIALFIAEIYITLNLAKENSHAVFKIFTAQQVITQQLIWLLTNCYQEVYISKPATSRAANDELYIIAKYCYPNIIRTKFNDIIQQLYNNQHVTEIWPEYTITDLSMQKIKQLTNFYLQLQQNHTLRIIQELIENNNKKVIHYNAKLYNAWVIPVITK